MLEEKQPINMSDREIREEMKERKSWDSRYFSLESEIEDREKTLTSNLL